ncbi:alanine racemase, partial [Candidatus Berkelbacteria bacterium RIFCSPHIGHO2_12_FULL_36_9]
MNNLFWVEINLSNLKSNIHNLKSLLNSKTKFMAVVKSNAYGHGMVEVAKVAVEAGADWLGVVSLDEAMRLRMKEARPPSLKTPILILGFVNPKNMKEAVENDISMPIVSLDHLKNVTRYTLHATRSLKVHLKIETGINRLGLQIDEIPRAFEMIKNNKNIVLEGVYSHFASVEEQNIDYANKQLMN